MKRKKYKSSVPGPIAPLLLFLAQALLGLPVLQHTALASQENIPLRPFTTDGCSGFPNGPFWALGEKEKNLWLPCCIRHDLAYWAGGTYQDRQKADMNLEKCVGKTGHPWIGTLMRIGVRIGGYTYLPTTWRWGYGWTYDRGYKPLSPQEKAWVASLTPVDPLQTRIEIPKHYFALPPPVANNLVHDPEVLHRIAHYVRTELKLPGNIESVQQTGEDDSLIDRKLYWVITDGCDGWIVLTVENGKLRHLFSTGECNKPNHS